MFYLLSLTPSIPLFIGDPFGALAWEPDHSLVFCFAGEDPPVGVGKMRVKLFSIDVFRTFALLNWCLGPESNRHDRYSRGILSPVCLPISPPRLFERMESLTDGLMTS